MREEAKAKAAAATTVPSAFSSAFSSLPPSLTPLQRRLLQPQQPTHDLSAYGGGGRKDRVAAARLLAVEAELSLRKKQREEGGEEEENSRRPRRRKRGDNSSSSSSSSLPAPLLPPRPPSLPSERSYVAICVVLRDQNEDLPEFVAWHAALGVKTFYLYDDRSAVPVTPELATSLLPSPSSSSSPSASASSSLSPSSVAVHVTRLTEEQVRAHPGKRPQLAAYDDCALSRRDSHSWLAFLDLDEFVTIEEEEEETDREAHGKESGSKEKIGGKEEKAKKKKLPSLPLLLSRFEAANAAAVLLHWRVFGSSGRNASKTLNSTTSEAFTSCLGSHEMESAHVKTIARTALLDVAEPCLGPHHFSFWDLKGAVDELERQEEEPEMEEEEEKELLQPEEEEQEEVRGEEGASKKKQREISLALSASAPYPVDVCGKRLDGPVAIDFETAKPPFAPAFLAHYAIKSREDYSKKMERGSAMGNRKTWEYFDSVESRVEKDESGEECLGAKRLAGKMREAGVLALPG